jgi:hypothetical protein
MVFLGTNSFETVIMLDPFKRRKKKFQSPSKLRRQIEEEALKHMLPHQFPKRPIKKKRKNSLSSQNHTT